MTSHDDGDAKKADEIESYLRTDPAGMLHDIFSISDIEWRKHAVNEICWFIRNYPERWDRIVQPIELWWEDFQKRNLCR